MEFKGQTVTARDISEMREWLEVFTDAEGRSMSTANLSDEQVLEKIEEMYPHELDDADADRRVGVERFLADGAELDSIGFKMADTLEERD